MKMSTNTILIITVLALISLDIVTGLIKAFYNNCFNSAEMRQGLIRKFTTIILVLMAFGLQLVATYIPELPSELGYVFNGTCLYVIAMELASNVENILAVNDELGSDKIRKFFGLIGETDGDQKKFN